MINACAFLLLCIMDFLPGWQSRMLTVYSVWLLALLIPLMQFAYVFPRSMETPPAESRRVLSVSIGFFMVGLAASLLSTSGIFPALTSDEVVIAVIFGGVELAWLLSLFVRQGLASSGEKKPVMGGLFVIKSRAVQTAFAYVALICVTLLAVGLMILSPSSFDFRLVSIGTSVGALWVTAAAVLLFLDNANEQTSLLQKFFIFSLCTVLSVVIVCGFFADITTQFLLVAGIIVLVSQALFIFIFRWLISRPLARLTHSITQINAGDWQAHIEIDANDELGFISQSFTNIINTVEIAAKALRQANLSLKQKLDEQGQLIDELHLAHERLQNVSRHFAETQEKERRRLAGELHDEVGQALTGIKLTMEMSRKMPQDAPRLLDDAQGLLMDLIHRVNDLSLNLRPVMLDEFGLLPALLYFFDHYTRQTGVEVFFQQNDLEEKRFSPELETAVYRIIQEALTNCARYAKVNEVSVRILMHDDTMLIEVEDHGIGFDSAANCEAGYTYGIAGMMERAALIGGKLDVESNPGSGTFICARLPIHIIDKNETIEIEKEYSG